MLVSQSNAPYGLHVLVENQPTERYFFYFFVDIFILLKIEGFTRYYTLSPEQL